MRVSLLVFHSAAVSAVALLATYAALLAAAASLADGGSYCCFLFGTHSDYLLTSKDGFKIECPATMQARIYCDCALPTLSLRLVYNCNPTPFGYMTITNVGGSAAMKECAGETLKEQVTKNGVPVCKTVSPAYLHLPPH
jgi:hypothetical protein